MREGILLVIGDEINEAHCADALRMLGTSGIEPKVVRVSEQRALTRAGDHITELYKKRQYEPEAMSPAELAFADEWMGRVGEMYTPPFWRYYLECFWEVNPHEVCGIVITAQIWEGDNLLKRAFEDTHTGAPDTQTDGPIFEQLDAMCVIHPDGSLTYG